MGAEDDLDIARCLDEALHREVVVIVEVLKLTEMTMVQERLTSLPRLQSSTPLLTPPLKLPTTLVSSQTTSSSTLLLLLNQGGEDPALQLMPALLPQHNLLHSLPTRLSNHRSIGLPGETSSSPFCNGSVGNVRKRRKEESTNGCLKKRNTVMSVKKMREDSSVTWKGAEPSSKTFRKITSTRCKIIGRLVMTKR